MPQLPHEKFSWRHDKRIKLTVLTIDDGGTTELDLTHDQFQAGEYGVSFYHPDEPNVLVFQPWYMVAAITQDKSDDKTSTGADS